MRARGCVHVCVSVCVFVRARAFSACVRAYERACAACARLLTLDCYLSFICSCVRACMRARGVGHSLACVLRSEDSGADRDLPRFLLASGSADAACQRCA